MNDGARVGRAGMRREPSARLQYRKISPGRVARDLAQGQLRQYRGGLRAFFNVRADPFPILQEVVDAPVERMIERSPLVHGGGCRKVDVGFDTSTIARQCRQSLGGNVLGRRL